MKTSILAGQLMIVFMCSSLSYADDSVSPVNIEHGIKASQSEPVERNAISWSKDDSGHSENHIDENNVTDEASTSQNNEPKKRRYMDGNRESNWIEWSESTKKNSAGHPEKRTEGVSAKAVVRNGVYIEWFRNGQKKIEGAYKNGKKDGTWIEWDETGRKITEQKYLSGILQH